LKTFAIFSGVLKILKKLASILYYFMVYIKYFDLWALREMKNSNAKVRIEATNLERPRMSSSLGI
jgi:hypothetical protein